MYPSHNVEEVSTDLNLKVSAFFGVEKLGEYKAAPILENFSKVTVVNKIATVINSSWYPHKLELNCEYDLKPSTLDCWIAEYRNPTNTNNPEITLSDEQKRIAELEAQNKQLLMEVDILKQAALIIGKRSKKYLK